MFLVETVQWFSSQPILLEIYQIIVHYSLVLLFTVFFRKCDFQFSADMYTFTSIIHFHKYENIVNVPGILALLLTLNQI